MAVVLTVVQTKRITINIHKRNNTKELYYDQQMHKVISQIITLLQVSTLSCHPQADCNLIIIIIITTAIQLSLGGSSPYSSTDRTDKNKYI